ERLDERQIHQRTGCRLHAAYWPAKLLWLREAEPEAFGKTARWLSFGEYFQWRLTGELASSLSMASGTGLLNQLTGTWDEELLAVLPLEPSQLPLLVDVDHWLGADWSPAVGDGATSNLGSGCFDARRLAVNVGTSSAMRLLWESEPLSPPPELWSYRLDRRRILLGGALSEGGNLWAWLRQTLRLPRLGGLEKALASMQPDAHGLTILPFLAGERSPGWHADARLTVHGMGAATTVLDVLRAALEAIAYRLAIVHEGLRPYAPDAEVVASGGAILRSPAWLQILADVLGRPVHALADTQATLRGTALLGLRSAGVLDDFGDAEFAVGRTYEPVPAAHARYEEAIGRQRRLYERVLGN
ncbi:MAG TPA: FGGY-family carbohydrate kinase, partial [Chloroflexota bacterium]|nr:FGGY-family carbohydrate kinase [Chloroflexota bacterium]